MLFIIIEFIQGFIALQCLIFSFYLLTADVGKDLSNKILGYFLIALGIEMVLLILLSLNNIYIYRFALSLRFIFGPLLYFYVKTSTEKEYQIKGFGYLHFLPFLAMLVLLNLNVNFNRVVILIAVNLSSIGYLVASIIQLKSYQKVIKEISSSYYEISYSWLLQLLSLLTVVIGINFINNTFAIEYRLPSEVLILLETLVLLFLVIIMVYKALRNPTLFSGISEADIQLVEDSRTKYETSPLNENDLKKYKGRVEEIMKTQQPYLNPDLVLSDLADLVTISNRELSQVINTQFNQNFSEYINQYRVEHALQIFDTTEDKKITVLEVLYEVGFNSKSSFYNAFKKITGTTPKKYRASRAA